MIIEKNRIGNNGAPAKRNCNRITHVQFAQLVDAIKKHKQKLLDERPRKGDAAAFLSKELGFGITPSTMDEAAEYAGADWVPRARSGGAVKYTVSRLRALTLAVRGLYENLGLEVPGDLMDQ